MKNIIIILISILSLSVKGQNIPVKYQGQYVIKHSWVEQCLSNLSANPFQMFEMTADEKNIYNKLVSQKKDLLPLTVSNTNTSFRVLLKHTEKLGLSTLQLIQVTKTLNLWN